MNLGFETKITALAQKQKAKEPIKILILGLGSVGCFLLEYLISLADPKLHLVVAGRDAKKIEKTLNILKVSATIREQMKSKLESVRVDIQDKANLRQVLSEQQPDFIINTSRAYSGLKYGSISWEKLRAYGIWTPLALTLVKPLMETVNHLDFSPVVINTSYPDATHAWIKSAGTPAPDFGSGNLNHLIPRMKLAVAKQQGIEDLNQIHISLATSHFHDVCISKEGQDEGVTPLVKVFVEGQELNISPQDLFRQCAIAMPHDHNRNRMNASSTFEVITKLIRGSVSQAPQYFSAPGPRGYIGGYPIKVDEKEAVIDEADFTMDDMMDHNQQSLALDGVAGIEAGVLTYTDELCAKVQDAFGVALPQKVTLDEAPEVAAFLIKNLIEPTLKSHQSV